MLDYEVGHRASGCLGYVACLRDKLFAFGGYQGTVTRQNAITNTMFIPTEAALHGDFTALASAACNGGIAKTLTYVGGLALFYALLGMIAGMTGSLFGTIGASFWARLVIGNLLLVFALAMLEVIPVRMPARLSTWAGSLGGGSYPAVFLLGATSGLVAAPCGAPAFAAVLTWVATTHSAVLGFLYLFVFSLGMSALLVVVGFFSGALAALPRAGAWMSWIKKAAGVVLLLMAEYYFVKAGQVW